MAAGAIHAVAGMRLQAGGQVLAGSAEAVGVAAMKEATTTDVRIIRIRPPPVRAQS